MRLRDKHRPFAPVLTALFSLSVTGLAEQREPEARPHAIPFELTSSKPFVQVQVNDCEPLWFIFDTGNTGGFCIDRRRALTMGLELEGEHEAHTGAGAGTRVRISQAQGITFRIGHVLMPSQPARVVGFDHIASYEGRPVDGLIGRSFISRFVVELDYGSKLLRLHDPETFEYSGPGQAIPIGFMGGLIATRATVTVPDRDPIEGTFVIDTGARPALVFNRPFVEKHKLLEALPNACAATIGGGAGGECKGYVGRLESMQLGPFLLKKPVAAFSEDRVGVLASDAFAGIIGGPILRRCRVFLDYQRKRVILEPYAAVPAPYEYDMSGLFLMAVGPDLKTFRVMSVMENSPAAEAGLKRGDVITAVNGRPVAEFPLEQVRRLFMRAGQECSLEVRRGDQNLRAKLKTRRLI